MGDASRYNNLINYKRVQRLLKSCRQVEDYLWPRAGRDWLASLDVAEQQDWYLAELQQFRHLVHRWQGAVMLPIDQLTLSPGTGPFPRARRPCGRP